VRGHGGHPLCVLDDHSRYNVLLAACADQTEAKVQTHLTSAFRLHGLPDSVLWDIAWDSDGSLRPNHGECVREFWHAPRLQIAGEKWTIGFGVHSNVVLKYRY